MKNFIKKLAIYLITITTITGVNLAILEVANAVGTAVPEGILSNDLNQYKNLYPATGEGASNTPYVNELASYNKLTSKSYIDILASLIRTMLFLVSSLTVIALVLVGILYLTGSLSEDNISKAKKILGYVGIAILIISASYGIIAGILEINFF